MYGNILAGEGVSTMANPNKLPVLEVFGPTIQGEGIMIGVQTTFIRSVHCDYACRRCDSKHAVEPDQYKGKEIIYTAEELFDELMKIQGHCEWVTISGGNPALWDFSAFVELCQRAGIKVAVETQGSVYKPWLASVDQLTISPKGPGMQEDKADVLADLKTFMKQLTHEVVLGTAIKIPVFGEKDLDFAEKVMELVADVCQNSYVTPPLYLSLGNDWIPGKDNGLADHRNGLLDTMDVMIEAVLKRPALSHAIVLPQLHVLIYGNRQLV